MSLDKLISVLKKGVELGGSDIHITAGAPLRVRVYGSLRDMYSSDALSTRDVRAMLEPLMDAKMRKELDSYGQIDRSYEISQVARFRVNIFRQHGAESAVFRVLHDKIPPFDSLGLPEEVRDLINLRRGMVLVTGATGSGKSTTLASMLDIINRSSSKHIITLEEPVEYQHWHSSCNVSQREIGRDVRDFESGLRSALRQDPDIILVGEMRDQETTEIALRASETGHLLLSTLHTNGAVETVYRIIDMYPEARHHQVRNQLASSIEAIISQQLLPRKDGEGYVLALELLLKNREVQNLIVSNRVLELHDYLLSAEAKSEGMLSMDESIIKLVESGVVTVETALAYAVDKRKMRLALA